MGSGYPFSRDKTISQTGKKRHFRMVPITNHLPGLSDLVVMLLQVASTQIPGQSQLQSSKNMEVCSAHDFLQQTMKHIA